MPDALHTIRELAARLYLSESALHCAVRAGALIARRPTPEERAALLAAGRLPSRRAYARVTVVEDAEVQRYLRERRPLGRPRRTHAGKVAG